MCLWDQGIDDNTGVVGIEIWARGLRDNDKDIGRGKGIDNASEGSETTNEMLRIEVQRQRLQRRHDGTEKLATTTEASVEEDDPKVLTTTTDVSAEEAEETMRPSESL